MRIMTSALTSLQYLMLSLPVSVFEKCIVFCSSVILIVESACVISFRAEKELKLASRPPSGSACTSSVALQNEAEDSYVFSDPWPRCSRRRFLSFSTFLCFLTCY